MKYTNKQKRAIENLLSNLDELENKPRRLYGALEEFAEAFDKKEAIPSILDAQDTFYSSLSKGESYDELFTSLREFRIEEWRSLDDDPSRTRNRIDGANAFIRYHIGRINE